MRLVRIAEVAERFGASKATGRLESVRIVNGIRVRPVSSTTRPVAVESCRTMAEFTTLSRCGAWRRLSLNGLAILARVSEKKVRDELEATVVPRVHAGENGALVFSLRDALFFRLLDELPGGMELTRDSRRALYVLLRDHKAENASWRRARTCVHGMRGVESKPDVLGGTPVFRGTRVSVRDIGELVKRGMSRDELEVDYPTLLHLDEEDLEFAAMFAGRNRARGRPREPIELRRAPVGSVKR